MALQSSDKDIERVIDRTGDLVLGLERYIREIELFNSAYGLVGASDTEELIIKHILDSLAPLGIISRLLADEIHTSPIQIADVGSGAGLPGIPLAVALPLCEFSLIERMGRRVGFLCNTKAVLSLSNVTIEESDIEKIANERGFNGRFNLVTFRAFKPLEPKLLKSLLNVCAPGGLIAAYKGKREKIEAEMLPLRELCGQWEAIPYTVPFLDEERHLLVIRR
ncbi:MAG: 16S rRNA (guanine(527)-N(7))-methyltransferase RsmG [Treponema sp.]|nr:16S rRNA (guanine(527)-N(7))-methyltransferase RsmG [Treponema sp.]